MVNYSPTTSNCVQYRKFHKIFEELNEALPFQNSKEGLENLLSNLKDEEKFSILICDVIMTTLTHDTNRSTKGCNKMYVRLNYIVEFRNKTL